MAITKITTPDLIDLPFNNTDGIVLAKGSTGAVASIQYLVVAGGGSGGGGNTPNGGNGGGGGGAGGLLTATADFAVGSPLNLIVGEGGGSAAFGSSGSNGFASIFSNINSTGGGAGGSNANGGDGGSGGGGGGDVEGTQFYGGSATTSPVVQGYAGGDGDTSGSPYNFWGGGGGGGGAVGVSGNQDANLPDGGAGLQNNITGTNLYYAGGGGGGNWSDSSNTGQAQGGIGGGGNGSLRQSSSNGFSGTINTGGGGGGGGQNGSSGAGGSGIIILRMPSGTTAAFSAGITFTFDNTSISGQNIYRITATTNSTQTVTFSSTAPSTGRPTTNLSDGEFRYNTTTKKVEFFDGAKWFALTSTTSVPQAGTTGACNYPATATALYQLNSGVGSNVPDTCGNYDGTGTSITYSAGKFGNAASFNGSSSYIQIPAIFSSGYSNSLSYSCWFKTSVNDSNLRTIIEPGEINSSGNFTIFIINGKLRLSYYNLDGSASTDGSTTVSDGNWHNLVAVLNNSTGNLDYYLDGNTTAEISHTFTAGSTIDAFANQVSHFGVSYYQPVGYFRFFSGQLDQVRIFPSALTQEQVTALATETAP